MNHCNEYFFGKNSRESESDRAESSDGMLNYCLTDMF